MRLGQDWRWVLAVVALGQQCEPLNMFHSIRLDYLSCVLTVLGTVLIGRKLWQGWIVAAINSAVVCIIGIRTAQFGLVPANLLCIALYTSNLFAWRFKKQKLFFKPDRPRNGFSRAKAARTGKPGSDHVVSADSTPEGARMPRKNSTGVHQI